MLKARQTGQREAQEQLAIEPKQHAEHDEVDYLPREARGPSTHWCRGTRGRAQNGKQ